MQSDWRLWKYKNLTILLLTFILSLVLGSFKPFRDLIFDLDFFAAFLAGIMFISTFTAPVAAVTILVLAQKLSMLEILVVAGAGAILADFTIFRLVKDNLGKEVTPIYENVAGNHFHKILHTKHFRWLFPVLGALIILSPLPKDLGTHLMGIPKLKNYQFILFSAGINVIGIIFILFLSIFIKP